MQVRPVILDGFSRWGERKHLPQPLKQCPKRLQYQCTPEGVLHPFNGKRLHAAFLRGTFAPERRASLMPMAIACFRFFTLPPRPDFSLPCLYSCITFPTLFRAFLLYLR